MEEKEEACCPVCGQAVNYPATISKPHTPGSILEVIATNEGVHVLELKSSKRDRHIARARQLFFYVARQYNKKFTLKELGEEVHRDHATVIYGLEIIGKLVQKEEIASHVAAYLQALSILSVTEIRMTPIFPVAQTIASPIPVYPPALTLPTEGVGNHTRTQSPSPLRSP